MSKRLRLLKVVVQPVFLVDDGENLSELTVAPVTVAAADWPAWAEAKFSEMAADLRQQVEAT